MPEPAITTGRTAGLILMIIWLSGCMQQTPAPPTLSDCPSLPTQEMADLADRNQTLEADLAASRAETAELNRTVADLEIRMLQKEALANDLQRRVSTQQQRLDDAITEVVRTKSKLRSIESKAEAASTIAEAEIAVKSMQSRVEAGNREKMAELEKAQRLLDNSTTEFKALNYGGALYLAVQARALARAGDRNDHRSQAGSMEGEVVFDQPLPLVLTKNTNLRAGPGLKENVLTTLKMGTPIVGYAHKGDWIRVHTENGNAGWVHHSLVMAR
jgi:hypothetical protein